MSLPQVVEALDGLSEAVRIADALPPPRSVCVVAGTPGSSDAVLVTALAQRKPNRFFLVIAEDVADAERWLADLGTLRGAEHVAFYPPRESFGEAEPHAEIAGERVETLEKMASGAVSIVITTGRALLERTQ